MTAGGGDLKQTASPALFALRGKLPTMTKRDFSTSLGLLLLRLSGGLAMAIQHGWGKIQNFNTPPEKFPDPTGITQFGNETLNVAGLGFRLASVGEFVFALLVAVGLFTRLSAIPVAFAMGVAFFGVHWADVLKDDWPKAEPSFLYLAVFVTIILTGPGAFSLDRLIFRKKNDLGVAVR